MPKTRTIWLVAEDLQSVKAVDAVVDEEGTAHVAVMRGMTPGIDTYGPGDWFDDEETAKIWQAVQVAEKVNGAYEILIRYEGLKKHLIRELAPTLTPEQKSALRNVLDDAGLEP